MDISEILNEISFLHQNIFCIKKGKAIVLSKKGMRLDYKELKG